MLEGFTNQRVGKCMVSTLASMDLCEQLTTLFPGYAPQLDVVGTTLVGIPFYQHVLFSHMNDPFSGCKFIRKDVIFQVVLDLSDPCIGTDQSIWILRTGVHGVPCDACDP
jgi:hypothetical protein